MTTGSPIDPAFRADCARCQGLCCAAEFRPEWGFPVRKPSGVPCEHLDCRRFTCRVFGIRELFGYTGCAQYDCFGAGQVVSAVMLSRGHVWPALDADAARRYVGDMSTLYRIRVVITGLLLGLADDPPLLERLKAASDKYGQEGEPAPETSLRWAIEHHRAAVEQALAGANLTIADIS